LRAIVEGRVKGASNMEQDEACFKGEQQPRLLRLVRTRGGVSHNLSWGGTRCAPGRKGSGQRGEWRLFSGVMRVQKGQR